MSERPQFEREQRYIVVKLTDLEAAGQRNAMTEWLRSYGVRTRSCVVVEADWPEYEPVWQMLEERVTGAAKLGEREAFEAYLLNNGEGWTEWHLRQTEGEYENEYVKDYFGVWMARAAIAAQEGGKSEPCLHNEGIYQGLGKPDVCRDCGEEL